MAYPLGDIYIGNFPRTQGFGERPQFYNARFGIKGHNGEDYSTPNLTQILSAANGFVLESDFDKNGYGNYVKILHDGYLTLYGHLNDRLVNVKERVVAGQLIGHSGMTGLADGFHVHFGVAPASINGIKTEKNNGYAGYIDPSGERCAWTLKNPQAPVVQSPSDKPGVLVNADDYPDIISEGSNYIYTATYALGHGLNEFLQANNLAILDLQNNKSDPEGGKKLVQFISHLLEQIEAAKAKGAPEPTEEQKKSFIAGLRKIWESFVYKQ